MKTTLTIIATIIALIATTTFATAGNQGNVSDKNQKSETTIQVETNTNDVQLNNDSNENENLKDSKGANLSEPKSKSERIQIKREFKKLTREGSLKIKDQIA